MLTYDVHNWYLCLASAMCVANINITQLQIDSKDSKTNCMIKVVHGILKGSNDASPTQMPMQEDAGYVAKDVHNRYLCLASAMFVANINITTY
jgi:hypothetical protein